MGSVTRVGRMSGLRNDDGCAEPGSPCCVPGGHSSAMWSSLTGKVKTPPLHRLSNCISLRLKEVLPSRTKLQEKKEFDTS